MSLDVAIVIGHNARSQGAVAHNGETEHAWNTKLALQIPRELEKLGLRGAVMWRPTNGTYSAQMTALAEQIRAHDSRCAMELHFNSVKTTKTVDTGKRFPDGSAVTREVPLADEELPRRTTVLHWPSSSRGQAFAAIAAQEIADAIGGKDRARSARGQADSWAGAPLYFLSKTSCPAVICEPHFGCTPDDHAAATAARDDFRLAAAYARAVQRFLTG